jgi:hypothetical protein
MEANRKRDREDLKGMMTEMNAKMDGNQAQMRSTLCAFRSELKETIQQEMKAVIQPIRAELDETTTCQEATETEPDPGVMQSIEEHQEISKREVALLPVGGPRKRHRVCNLPAERRQNIRERTRRNSGSRRKSIVACSKVSCRAIVAWRKRNIIRKVRIQESRESRKELAVARRKVLRREEVAWRKRHIARKVCTRANVVREIQRGRAFGRRRQQEAECSNGISSRSVEKQVYLRKGRKPSRVSEDGEEATTGKYGKRSQGFQENHGNGVRKASKLDVQRATKNDGTDLVEGSTPSKKEKETTVRAEAGNVETPAPNR